MRPSQHSALPTLHATGIKNGNGVWGRGQGNGAGDTDLKNPVELVGWSVELSTAGDLAGVRSQEWPTVHRLGQWTEGPG